MNQEALLIHTLRRYAKVDSSETARRREQLYRLQAKAREARRRRRRELVRRAWSAIATYRTTSKEATRKRILLLLGIATVTMAASVSPAQAAVVTNDKTSVGYAGFVPCANGGAGEILSGRIDVHNLVTSTVNGNNVSYQFQFQPEGGSMVGAITGDIYRVAGVTRGTSHEGLAGDHYVLTYVSTFQLTGPGPGNNLRVRETAHVTIDGDEVVVQHDDFGIDCT